MKSVTTSLAFAAILAMLTTATNAQCYHPIPKAPIVKVPHTSLQKVRRVCPVSQANQAPTLDGRVIANDLKTSLPATWLSWIWP